MKIARILLAIGIASVFSGQLNAQVDVIYGRDNRFEVQDYDNSLFIEKAKSVALRVSNRKLSVNRENHDLIDFAHITLIQSNPSLCSSERFKDQVALGSCSGFLVAPDKIMTAGHCMFSKMDCKNNQWIFDYVEGTEKIKKENIYSCKKIIVQKYNYDENEVVDYAVIQLDHPVKDRQPLAVRKFGVPLYDTPLVLIGHPHGLPMKIADGARVTIPNLDEREHLLHSLKLRENYFTANLDSFAGNSGSPVFNELTGKVEGIVTQGADDYEEDSKHECLRSVHRGNSAKHAEEKVMRITKVKY
jgi:V8-like Glu-specific endopeptidase